MTTEVKSASIGASFSLIIHIVMAVGLFLFGRTVVQHIPVPQGQKTMKLHISVAANRPRTPQSVAPVPESLPEPVAPTPKPKPKHVPKPKPKPLPAPTPKPVAESKLKPEPTPTPKPVAKPEPEPESVTPPAPPTPEPVQQVETAVEPPAPPAQVVRRPPPSPAPTGDPEAEARIAKLKQRVPSVLHARLEAAKHYPFSARRAGVTGTVPVKILVAKDGRILSAAVAEDASAHKWLLKGARKTLENLSMTPLFEGVSLERDLLVVAPLVYELH